ncbi:MAG: TRAP transporter large permease subunit [Alphaproteobacteria bacterium]|nr:TRAP transporter large permease subunit [Alphaproteobacteria bacterium]
MAEARVAAPAGIDAPADRGIVARIDRGIATFLGTTAAVLVAAEIVILFAGILARYVFHRPLVWSDELASILFLWLAVLGSAMAFQRGENLRMMTLANQLPAAAQRQLEAVALAASIAFLVMILPASLKHVELESVVITATLELSMTWRTLAMPIGIGLTIVLALLRVAGQPRREMLQALALVAAVCAALWLAKPMLLGLGKLNLVIFFLVLVPLTVFAGVPIAFSFGLATFGYLALATRVSTSVLVARLDAGMSHFILLSIPLFVFLGLLIEMTGMAALMVRFLANLLGHVRGGLHYVLVAAMYLVSGISGSKAADMAAIAPALFPEMEKRGADRGDLSALLAATGAQTETIPPSLILITLGSVTGMSIAALFTGGLLPGAVLGLALCAVVWRRSRRDTRALPARAGLRPLASSFVIALPALALPFVIRSSVIEGVATATEVSTIGIVYSLIVGLFVYRRFDWSRVMPMLARTASLSGAILLIVGAATAMAWAITQSGFSQNLAHWISQVPGGKASFIVLSIVLFIVLGSVLEGLPAIVLFGPLMFPIAREVGVHEVHYAMIAILAMGVGLFAPPFGIGYYASCAIGGCDADRALPHIWTYLAALMIGLAVVAAVPWISVGFL